MVADLELGYMSAVEARNLIRDRRVSLVDLVKAFLQRIEELNGTVLRAVAAFEQAFPWIDRNPPCGYPPPQPSNEYFP